MRAWMRFGRAGRARVSGVAVALGTALIHAAAWAHTMPYFTWFQVEREALVSPEEVRVIHTCRLDPQSFRGDDPLVDLDGDTTATEHELADCCTMAARYLAQDFLALADGQPVPVALDRFRVLDGGNGFRTELIFRLPEAGRRLQVGLMDPAFLVPRAQSAARETTGSVVSSTTASVTLLADSGDFAPSIPLPPRFLAEFTVDRAAEAISREATGTGLLDRYETEQKSSDSGTSESLGRFQEEGRI